MIYEIWILQSCGKINTTGHTIYKELCLCIKIKRKKNYFKWLNLSRLEGLMGLK